MAQAGAWLQPEGHGLFIAQANYYTTKSFFDAAGHKQSQPRFTKYEFQPYGEYGVTPWLTLGGSAYAERVSQSGDGNIGVADPEIFARSEVWGDGTQHLSIQPLIKLPSSFRDAAPPRGGSRGVDAELSLLYGTSPNLLSASDYLDTRVGYRVRGNNRSPEWRADVALGLGVTPDLQLVPALRGVLATNLKAAPAFSENGDLDASVLKAEVTGLYHLNSGQWVQASLFRNVIGTQTGAGYGASLGFAQRF